MSATSAAPATVPPPVAGQLDEFSDRLSPMLVKELRQGLRAKTFVVLFLALQALLAVVLLSAIGASSGSESGITVSRVIFFFFSFAALVAQPLRGVGALHQEIKGNTIDLMVLTRLGAWRIVLGKWVAIVSQTALLLTAVVPYLILRYFFGRMDLFAELLLFLLVFLLSAALTAVTVGLSAIPSILLRGLMPLVASFYLGWGIIEITDNRHEMQELIEFCTLQADGTGWGLLTGLLVVGYLGWLALAVGASMIAPMAENHSSSRRLVTLGAMLLLGLLAWAGDMDLRMLCLLMMMVAVPAVAISLNEPLQLLPPICRPFLRFRGLGRIAGRFLYPGWPAGVLFTGLLAAVAIGLFSLGKSPAHWSSRFEAELMIAMSVSIGTLLLPAIIVRVFARRMRTTLGFYVLFLVLLVFAAIGLSVVAHETLGSDDNWMWWFAWIPPVQMNLVDLISRNHYAAIGYSGGSPDFGSLLTTSVAVTATYFLLLLIAALRNFGAIRAVEQEAENPTSTTES
jgi:hypothetical protein